ncbi:MAG: LysM peptidoglycan-binding domain-containing protein, partial [Myxococcales bacterium]|nr:LysM peptidoglycan-binding domain-containing protein [Myxococcales bacterium]
MRLRLALATFVCCVLGASTVDAQYPVPLPAPPPQTETDRSPPGDDADVGEAEEEADVEEPIDVKELKPAKPRVRPKVKPEKPRPEKKPKGDAVCEFRMPVYEHEVAEGDIVSSIAARYGVKLKDIKKWNPRLDLNKISIGKKIKVCPEIAPRLREEFTYAVKKGDSLSEVGEKYGLLARQIVRMQSGSLRR